MEHIDRIWARGAHGEVEEPRADNACLELSRREEGRAHREVNAIVLAVPAHVTWPRCDFAALERIHGQRVCASAQPRLPRLVKSPTEDAANGRLALYCHCEADVWLKSECLRARGQAWRNFGRDVKNIRRNGLEYGRRTNLATSRQFPTRHPVAAHGVAFWPFLHRALATELAGTPSGRRVTPFHLSSMCWAPVTVSGSSQKREKKRPDEYC